MPTTPFTLGDEKLIGLPSYRWLSIIPFTIDTAAVPSDPESLFATLRTSGAFNRPYIFADPAHGPFPVGEIGRDDYARESGADATAAILEAANGQASWMDEPDPPAQDVVDEIIREARAWPDDAVAFHLLVDCYEADDRLHELGFTLFEFDEHVILDAASGRGWFVVLGMD